MTDKTATAGLTQGSSLSVIKHVTVAERFGSETKVETEVLCTAPCWEIDDRLVLTEESNKHLTLQSLMFSGSFTVRRIGTVAVHLTIDTERKGDS